MTKRKSPAELDRDIATALSKRSHATISAEHIAERRKRDPGAYSSRSQLVEVARNAAAAVFAPRKIAPSKAVIQKAKSAAFKAIQRHDPLAGTADHPAAAYAHGIMDIVVDATEVARQRWEMLRHSLKKLRRGHATKKRAIESQEMKDLREEKAALLRALDYAANTAEQMRAYHRRVDEISARMRALPR